MPQSEVNTCMLTFQKVPYWGQQEIPVVGTMDSSMQDGW